jgi:alpha-L-arabinofuranosidase
VKLSKEEQALVLKHRQEQEEDKPKLQGFAKHNIYMVNDDCYQMGNWWFSQSARDEVIQDFIEHFDLAAKKGSKFVCFIIDKRQSWYDDDGYGIDNMSDQWAQENLQDITEIKPKTKRARK